MTSTTTHSALEKDLHDLCQPLTSLMCLLEYGQMLGGEDALQHAVDNALIECRRAFEAVATMRTRWNDDAMQREIQ